MAVNLSSLLNKPTDEVKRPVLLPEGTYFGTIGSYKVEEIGKNKTPGCILSGKLTHAHEDVDLTGEDGQPIEVNGKNFPNRGNTLWLSDDSLYIFLDFAKSLGIEVEGQTIGAILPQLTGQSVMVDIGQEPVQDNTGAAVVDDEGNVRMRNTIRRISAPKD